MGHPGVGVMIGALFDDGTTDKTLKEAINKTISRVWLDEEKNALRFQFEDGTEMSIYDSGQSCCESRYMRTDDDLTQFSGAAFTGTEVRGCGEKPSDYGEVHEIQFLEVFTTKGQFTMANHNEHNGYYGGFCLCARPGMEMPWKE